MHSFEWNARHDTIKVDVHHMDFAFEANALKEQNKSTFLKRDE